MSSPLLEPDTNIGTTRSDRIAVQSIQELRSSDMVNKAHSWFTSLIANQDVLNSTKIDTNVLSAIVDKAAGAASAFERNLREEWLDKTLLDIGVLRFPDPEKPFFQLYRIKLIAWANEHRFLGHNINGCGISGEYNSRIFEPRESVISGLRQEVMKRASEEAVALFGST